MARARATARAPAVTAQAVILLFMTLVGQSYGQLKFGFYNGKCGTNNVEKVIFDIVKVAFDKDRSVVADLILLHFNDCFVRGCDASILLDGSNTEKTAWPNGIVRGYDFIDEIKKSLEEKCPRIVSCADIIVIATRVAVFLAGGVWYDIKSGRRDGMISQATTAIANLAAGSTIRVPKAVTHIASNFLTADQIRGVMNIASTNFYAGSTITVPNGALNLATNSLNATQLITLLSLYNGVRKDLGSRRGKIQSIYNGVRKELGSQTTNSIYRSAQHIVSFTHTQTILRRLSTHYNFQFSSAMKILSTFEVLTGYPGQIRIDCRRIN